MLGDSKGVAIVDGYGGIDMVDTSDCIVVIRVKVVLLDVMEDNVENIEVVVSDTLPMRGA